MADDTCIDRAVQVVEPDHAICHLKMLVEMVPSLRPRQCVTDLFSEVRNVLIVVLARTMRPAMATRAQLTLWMTHAIAGQKILV